MPILACNFMKGVLEMKKFENPALDIEKLEVDDVLTTSPCADDFVCDAYEPCDWEA